MSKRDFLVKLFLDSSALPSVYADCPLLYAQAAEVV